MLGEGAFGLAPSGCSSCPGIHIFGAFTSSDLLMLATVGTSPGRGSSWLPPLRFCQLAQLSLVGIVGMSAAGKAQNEKGSVGFSSVRASLVFSGVSVHERTLTGSANAGAAGCVHRFAGKVST